MLGLGNTLGRQSTPLSSAPAGFDKTWSFDSDTESWGVANASLSYQASYTPSSDTEKTGILVVERTNTSFETVLTFDLSSLPDYDSSSVLYYEIVYSIPQVNPSATTYTGLNRVIYGGGGNYDDYTGINSQTFNTWITVNGDLNPPAGTGDSIIITWDPSSFTFVAGAKIFIDSIRVSHTDFR